MKHLSTIGRILFALPFGILGINHFLMTDLYIMQVTTFIPGLGFTILLVGMALIAASISIILNKLVKISCILLATLLGLFIVTIHIPNLFEPAKSAVAMIELFKDTALLGGALMIAGNEKLNNVV